MAKRDDGLAGLALLGLFFGVGGVVVAIDQHDKRKAEQEQNRQALERVMAKLQQSETEFAQWQAILGPKNEQVRALAQEVVRLRQEVEYHKQLAKNGRAA